MIEVMKMERKNWFEKKQRYSVDNKVRGSAGGGQGDRASIAGKQGLTKQKCPK